MSQIIFIKLRQKVQVRLWRNFKENEFVDECCCVMLIETGGICASMAVMHWWMVNENFRGNYRMQQNIDVRGAKGPIAQWIHSHSVIYVIILALSFTRQTTIEKDISDCLSCVVFSIYGFVRRPPFSILHKIRIWKYIFSSQY